jgi:hypothetical protein
VTSIERILADVPLPEMTAVRQRFDRPRLDDVEGELRRRIRAALTPGALQGRSVAVGVGSRGMADLPLLVRTVVDELRAARAEPFVVPSMGSHGGATAAGQQGMLAQLGVTEASVGAPIRATMDTVEIGRADGGLPVHLDAFAASADAIVVVNVVKPHVSFRGAHESGLMKMIAVGLGKQRGADVCHEPGYDRMAERVVAMARVALRTVDVAFAVGVVENAYGEICELAVPRANEIEDVEPGLLVRARELAPRLFLDRLDVLVVDEIGKDVSGTGMDTNVIGRYHSPFLSGGPSIARIAVLDLTTTSDGNANGIGLADVTTERAFRRLRFDRTYPNALTTTAPTSVKIPMVLGNDRLAIQAAIKTSGAPDKGRVRLVRIRNTKTLDEIQVSAALGHDVDRDPRLQRTAELGAMAFDGRGDLL